MVIVFTNGVRPSVCSHFSKSRQVFTASRVWVGLGIIDDLFLIIWTFLGCFKWGKSRDQKDSIWIHPCSYRHVTATQARASEFKKVIYCIAILLHCYTDEIKSYNSFLISLYFLFYEIKHCLIRWTCTELHCITHCFIIKFCQCARRWCNLYLTISHISFCYHSS